MNALPTNPILRALEPSGLTAWLWIVFASASLLAMACSRPADASPTIGAVTSISVTPDVAVRELHRQRMHAIGRDAHGAIVPISPTWAVVASGGTIDSAGVFTAGRIPGRFRKTVRASSGGVAGYASVTVTEWIPPIAR